VFLIFGQNIGWTAINAFPSGSDLSVTWSLAIEEQFYLILPALVWFLPHRWLVRVLWACVIAAPVWRYCLHGSVIALTMFPPCRLDALMGGVLLASFVRGRVRSRWLWAVLTLLAPALDIALHPGPPYSVVALGFVGVLWLIVSRPPARLTFLRPLSWLGIGAYSIYLIHLPMVRLTGSPTLALPLTLAMAWVSWHYVEAPLLRFARRHLSSSVNDGRNALPSSGMSQTE
jgi:peptidoglycan/LPS O-acetylase OafA/YrhL